MPTKQQLFEEAYKKKNDEFLDEQESIQDVRWILSLEDIPASPPQQNQRPFADYR